MNELPPDVDEVVRDAAIRSRVVKLIEKEERKPPVFLERWADSSIGKFILTGIVGAALTVGFQVLGDHYKRDAERREARRVEALLLVDSLVGLLNDGYYIFSRTYDAAMGWDLASDSAKRVDSAFAMFNQRFERREAAYAARVCALTDTVTTTRFWNVADAVRLANPMLRAFRDRDSSVSSARALSALNTMRDSVFQFAADLARHASAPNSEAPPFGRICPLPQRH
jgi:hypothetical protein